MFSDTPMPSEKTSTSSAKKPRPAIWSTPSPTSPVPKSSEPKCASPWKRNGFDGISLEVDRGSGFVFLAVDTRPGYVDTTPFPAAGALWKYRAIYLLDDTKVGQWSATTTVRVG